MATLENRTKLLGDESLVCQVLSLHSQLFASAPMSPTAAKSQPIPASLSIVSTVASDAPDSGGAALTSPAEGRKHSLDSSRALLRMGSSVKSMLGSVRKLIRNDKAGADEGAAGRGLVSESVPGSVSLPGWRGQSLV